MKFKFAYENLMNHKKLGRDIAFRNFADARTEHEVEKTTLEKFYNYVDDSRRLNQEVAESPVLERHQLEILKWTQEFQTGQKIKIERQKETLQQKHETLEEKGLALSEAAKEFKIF